jgi:hypothetical protein
MKYRKLAALGALHGALLTIACGSAPDDSVNHVMGGTPGTGGSAPSGGTPTGGTAPSTGGAPSTSTGGTPTTPTGGTSTSTGGTPTTPTGGTPSTSTGGTASTNGGTSMGGMSTSTGGAIAGSTSTGGTGTGGAATGGASSGGLPKFSFFVTSYKALQSLSGTADGFGGDLRFGETGDGAGLRGADKICTQIAEKAMPGSQVKVWRAFLSAPAAGASPVVNAKDRVGTGPWYDRLGRLVSNDLTGLLKTRPTGDAAIINDLPNEDGVPNHNPDNTGQVDNHDMLTGSDTGGLLYTRGTNPTCSGWTTKEGSAGKPRCGHSWPRGVQSWISILDEAGCGAGVNLIEMGPPNAANPTVGSGGGYGGFYCLALAP